MEVGKACDFEEERKRLEKSFWEPGTSYADEVVGKLCLEICLIFSILPGTLSALSRICRYPAYEARITQGGSVPCHCNAAVPWPPRTNCKFEV